MMMRITAHQVHDKGEEGERWGEERVGVKELYRQVQACVSEQKVCYVIFWASSLGSYEAWRLTFKTINKC